MTATPEATVTAAFAAFARGDWRAVVALLDHRSLEMFREMQIGAAAAMQQFRSEPPPARGGSLAAISSADDAVTSNGSMRLEFMPGSPTLRDLASLSPQDFFVRWQEASHRMPFAVLVYGWIMGLFRRSPEPDAPPTMIGSVMEGDDVAHVLYRRHKYDEAARVDLVTLRRDQLGWRLELNAFGMRGPFFDNDIMLAWRATFWPAARAALGSWLKRLTGRGR